MTLDKMTFSEKFYAALREKNKSKGWQTAFAEKVGITQGALNKIIRGETKDPGLSTVSSIIQVLEEEEAGRFELPILKRENEIPVYAIAGAGPAILPDEMEPLFKVIAPPKYFRRSNYAILIDGHSMEPLIPNGSLVGIRLNDPFKANELFLVHIPYEGLVVKRVGIDLKTEEFIFKSENPNKNAYPDFRLSINEAEKIIIGRVVWVMLGY